MTEGQLWRRGVQLDIPHFGEKTALSVNEITGAAMFGVSGRPVFESDAVNPAHVLFVRKPFQLDGGREGQNANMSSFKEVAGVFPQSQGLTSHIRNEISPYGSETTPADIYRALNAVIALPHWLVLRADKPTPNGLIPTYITAASKIASGPIKLYDDLTLAEFSLHAPIEKGSEQYRTLTQTKPFIEEVFSKGALLAQDLTTGESDHACPAPRRMIEQLAVVMFDRPADNSKEMGDMLGLSPDEIRRAADFGVAYRQTMIFREAYRVLRDVPSIEAFTFMTNVPAKWHELGVTMNNALGRETSRESVMAARRQ